MVLRILRRVARVWVPEGPASTGPGRGTMLDRKSDPGRTFTGPADDANHLGKRFYQLISEAGSFRSLDEVHTDFVAKPASPKRKGTNNGLFCSIFIRHVMQTGGRRASCPGDP
jgi:hypothetical protein